MHVARVKHTHTPYTIHHIDVIHKRVHKDERLKKCSKKKRDVSGLCTQNKLCNNEYYEYYVFEGVETVCERHMKCVYSEIGCTPIRNGKSKSE